MPQGMSVQHNMVATNAKRMHGITAASLAKSSEKLASGYRINRAADDAAGLAISEKMRRQIRGLTQATKNVKDGIGYCDVADGALEEVTSMLQNMNRLAVKAANDTLTNSDRKYIDDYVQQMKTEISRIFETTSFNDIKIWERDSVKIPSTPGTPVDNTNVSIISTSTENTITSANKGYIPDGDYLISATSAGMVVSWKGYDGYSYSSSLIPIDYSSGIHSFQLKDYIPSNMTGNNFNFTYKIDDGATEDDVVNALNGLAVNNIEKASESGKQYYEYHASGTSDVYWAYATVTYEALIASVFYENNYASVFSMLQHGDNREYSIDAQGNQTITGLKYYVDGLGPVTAVPNTLRGNGKTINLNGSVSINEVKEMWDYICLTCNLTDQANQSFMLDFELYVDGGWTKYNGNTSNSPIGLVGTSIAWDAHSGTTGSDHLEYLWNQCRQGFKNFQGIGISLESEGKKYKSESKGKQYDPDSGSGDPASVKKSRCMMIQAGSESSEADRIWIDYKILSLSVIGMEGVSTDTATSARKAIDEVKNAIKVVSEQRALFGSYANRLEHTELFLGNTIKNTSSSETQIRDTDIPSEMVRFSCLKILSQSGNSMLAQASKYNEGILQLLSNSSK